MKMKALQHIKATREYLDYVERHILNIEKAYQEVMDACGDIEIIAKGFGHFALKRDVEEHDVSKLGKHELTQYRDFFYPVGDKPAPPMKAFQHHYDHNNHHWENWTNNCDREYQPICCAHMVIDWLAMSYEFGDTPREYYEANKDEIIIPDWAKEFIFEIFDRIESNERAIK